MSIVAIDQGTTSTRALRVDRVGQVQAIASRELQQHYPEPGWVEHDPEHIWRDTLAVLREVIDDGVEAIGITNQRETILLWDRATGTPLHRAIVWQDRRTADYCAGLAADGLEPMIQTKTGLLADAYFSGTKLRWMLDRIPGARARAERGELAAGTVDCFLLWRLTGGRVHATDTTNAARTMLYDISAHRWDQDLLALLDIPAALLPAVHDNVHLFGETDPAVLGHVLPIAGMAGDQHAAMVGQGCFAPGMIKSTYGTGCFLLAHVGETPRFSTHRLLTTPAYRIGGKTAYALEGSIFVAGAAVKWLRDGLGILDDVQRSAEIAATLPYDHGVHFVPAFGGLGAPYWIPEARGMIIGIGPRTGPAHFIRAALEAAAFQTADLIDTIIQDTGLEPRLLRIDGGMARNDWLAQFLADLLQLGIERPVNHEATALGAACLAGLGIGFWSGLSDLPVGTNANRKDFAPAALPDRRGLRAAWASAVAAASR
ncbi:glycerol kinase GlpK [Flavisphingomonas formosensis]|uniref:glycerol kinase GlpK n=1 Tax=Flavisphingomonas formosensis TaxID=861534 RepID=UPI0012F84B45|nr:glycerol kinase GlpK [Sphingomonas formosensis]